MALLRDAFVIGSSNHTSWSQGYDADAFLKVLPHPDTKVPYKSAWKEWQKGQADYKNGNYTYRDPGGSYYSSWGPDKDKVKLTLKLSSFNDINIPGFGNIVANNTTNDTIYDDDFQLYNGRTQGPLIVADPGDTIKIKLVNDLPEDKEYTYHDDTNLHTHGLHVSPQGNGDNVLITVNSGDSWTTEINIPDDHFVGPDWYHPHLHGATNVQISKGLAGQLIIQPSTEEADDLDKFNPVTAPVYWMGLQTWALKQDERVGTATDPINQVVGSEYRIGTPIASTIGTDEVAQYEISDAEYIGYNYMPSGYDPTGPISPGVNGAYYGFGSNGEPIENVIHTVNGQYNPTIEANVGEWNLYGFSNLSVNTHHVVQVVREHNGELSVEPFELVAVDGDVAGAASDLGSYTETPGISPGARMTIQHAFTDPGTYYFLSNGTEELLGDKAPALSSMQSDAAGSTYKGFNDGHLVWGSQVLATVNVTGESIAEKPASPEPWDYIAKEAKEIDQWMAESQKQLDAGTLNQRTFIWSAFDATYDVDFSAFDDNDPSTFEGAYRINGRYFGHTPQEQTVVAMPMLGTTEEWTIQNTSLPFTGIDYQWGEWHPFHIHQNDFVVTEINGLSTDEIDYYPTNQLADTVLLGGAYIKGTATSDNPYGQGAASTDSGTPFETKIRMRFEDFPGAYVNHCHILFHEDAGMMQAVKVILNTDSTFIGGTENEGSANIKLGSQLENNINIRPYQGKKDNSNFNLAIGDVNYGQFFNKPGLDDQEAYPSGTKGYSDNITDVATIQKSLSSSQPFKLRIIDGDALKQAATGEYKLTGEANIPESGLVSNYIDQEANLKQLDVEGPIQNGSWNLEEMTGMTYLEDVYADDGSYLGWNANTNPKKITGSNGEAIPDTYKKGSFKFASNNGKDSLITKEDHTVDMINSETGSAAEIYKISDGTGRYKDIQSGTIIGEEVFWGGADIQLSSHDLKVSPEQNIQIDSQYILSDITPFNDISYDRSSDTSLAIGDVDGDGYGDIIAGIGGDNTKPLIEIYSGKDYSLMAKLNPFHGMEKTKFSLAAGDINSDNFLDIIVGQGEGGSAAVQAFSGRLLFDVISNSKGESNGPKSVQGVNPLNGKATMKATKLFTDDFHPFEDDGYKGAVDVSSGYILPRPENQVSSEDLDNVIQSSFANLIALKVNEKSTLQSPSIKTFYYTGGSGHASHVDNGSDDSDQATMFATNAEAKAAAKEMGCSGAHQMGSMWMACSSHMSDHDSNESLDIPTLESSLNIQRKLASINGSFIDLSNDMEDRGYGSLIGQTTRGKQYAYYIDTEAVQKGSMQVFKHNQISLNPGKSYVGTDKADRLTGSKNNDKIYGKESNDSLNGGSGDDLLKGGSGNDRLHGGRGNDRIIGGSGSNVLIGGAGRNTFVVGKGEDTIQDLHLNNDGIELSGNYQIIALGSDSRVSLNKNDSSVLVLGITADDLTNSDVIHNI